jgi:lambda family phage portal protein
MKTPAFLRRVFGGKFAAKKTQVRRFHAARIDRLSADWIATYSSINEELRGDLDRLRARGREMRNNNDYARKFCGMVETNMVGPAGFVMQARSENAPGKADKLANDAIEAAFVRWQTVCDVTGRQSLRDMCETLVGGLPSDGEFLVRLVRGPDAGNEFNFALQLIDVDRIDTTFNGIEPSTGNTVIMGVEVNAWRRTVAIHIFEAHPNDGPRTSRRRVRLPAEDVIHGFKVERAEQVRGIPWMAPGMLSLHHLGGFMLAAVLAAEHGANHFGFFTQNNDATPGVLPVGQHEEGDGGEAITTSQPGVYDTLPPGYDFKPHESKYPNEVFGPFVKTALQRVASGWRVSYHALANDLEGVNFSSIRSGTLDERDRWSSDQQWFIDILLKRVRSEWLVMSLLSNAITMPNGSPLPAAKVAKFAPHDWLGRRWEWVDPLKDMNARIAGVGAGLVSPQELSAQMGRDFYDTMLKIKEAQDLAKQLGIVLPAYAAKSVASAPKTTPKGQPAEAEEEEEEDEEVTA